MSYHASANSFYHLYDAEHCFKRIPPPHLAVNNRKHRQEATIMTLPAAKAKNNNNTKFTSPPARPKPPANRPSSTHSPRAAPSPTSSSALSLWRDSTASSPPRVRKASPSSSTASTGKPEWIAPPGKACSPTSIPVPTFLASARRRKSALVLARGVRREGDVGVQLTPPTPAGTRVTNGSVVEIPSPSVGEVDWNGEEIETPSGLPRRRTAVSNESGQSRTVGLTRPPRGLGLSFAVSSPRASSSLTGPTASLPKSPWSTSIISPTTSTPTANLISASSTKKHDSFSPTSPTSTNNNHFKTSTLTPISSLALRNTSKTPILSPFKHKRHLSPPTALPPSPSTLHPHISKTHITPSCTAGALTHRLSCGHLIVTLRSEVCARNCGDEGATYESARLNAMGFVRGYRGLDDSFACPVCISLFFHSIQAGQKVETVVEELRQKLQLQDDELWIARSKEFICMLSSESGPDASAAIARLGKTCTAVLEPAFLAARFPGPWPRKVAGKTKVGEGQGKKDNDRQTGLQGRFGRETECRYHVQLLQKEGRLKRLRGIAKME
ncbi:hypothetical protein AUEXF2481DRAFT_570375 [Aureobasidium subglaciale EXF-2481]|uniref:Uncharacterized protein n=1 Tax=Aureobasidium subglaciale (strain EXF-2481) TaxID=1043005 RepID=A0A074YUC8_AURSE|nr:uncharacterized protein AUEXF2481DRAFT_570375 [Aureobasidium subglaciale EXF-2481]KEQ90446.1 hypothetical protein AUEXF2481DRAFT_570375 [Aureobasidium subglaciale EXF-2481]